MNSLHYQPIISELKNRFGTLEKIGKGHTLYYIPTADIIVYLRYSKISNASKQVKKGFYGLRKEDIDLMRIQGKKSFICLITDDTTKNLYIPFQQFENYFLETMPSNDGQYKVLPFYKTIGQDIYFAGIGKFNSECFKNIDVILNMTQTNIKIPELSHTQVQSLISSIGIKNGYNIWIPDNDKLKLDSRIINSSNIINNLPSFNKEINNIISEIDVIWFDNNKPISFYEVEHSTPIYSGLLRFNDVLLSIANTDNFNIVANNERENKFNREVNRPTFRQNKLVEKVTFSTYESIYLRYYNLTGKYYEPV